MGEMEDKIGAILNNPQMMQQLMSMAQAFTAQQSPPNHQESAQAPAGLDLAMVQKLSGFAQKSNIDQRERALLGALQAYLSTDRIQKLEKAMRAAKLAQFATSALGQGGLSF